MAYVLTGVADAFLFKGDQLFATSQTLIDTSLAASLSAEELRGGKGNKLWAKYFHSSKLELTLTDLMFKLDYIAASVGSEIQMGGDILKTEQVTLATGGVGTVTGTPVAFDRHGIIGWITTPNSEVYQTVEFTGNTFTVPNGTAGDIKCIYYLETNEAARRMLYSANVVPETFTVKLVANLYSGDANNPTSGSAQGTVEITFPRFQPNGAPTIAMSATGSANTDLTGEALAYSGQAVGCNTESYYAEIVENIFGTKWYTNALAIQVDDATIDLAVGEKAQMSVYAIYANASPKLIDNSDLTFVSADPLVATVSTSGEVTGVLAGSTTVKAFVNDRTDLEAVAEVTVV